ncbi:MAG: hypothetical protein IKO04_07435 [Bacteroidales bacterium]|nr:hypothetical protein [Bacteroidales bacterium]
MKRYAYYLLIMAAAAMVACEAEPVNNSDPETPEVPELQNGTYIYTINASIPEEESKPEQIAVKSNYDSEGHFSWSAGDAISVLFHNGDDNKFFTLTTTGTGSAASFSGEIETGYEIGASDGTVSDKKIWVLFPASDSHAYTAGSTPTFFIPQETDYTADGAHWSANMPMYDLMTDEGDISFKNLCSGYVFTFNNINSSVNKVMLTVDNNAKTYKVSGSLPLALDSEYYMKPGWGDSGSPRTISFVANVDAVNHRAVFYVPTRPGHDYFQPVIDLVDYETGNTITHLSAGSSKTTPVKGTIQPITIDTKNSAGTPPSFTSKFGITWTDVSDSAAGNSATISDHNNMLTVFKATSDASYIYLYFEMTLEGLLRDSSYEYANSIDVYLGNSESASSSWMWNSSTKYTTHPFAAWLTKYGPPAVNSWESVYYGSGAAGGNAERFGGKAIYEVKLERSYDACLQIAGTINVGMVINYQKYHGGSLGSAYMYVPTNGSTMLQIDVPAYVAP